MLPQSPKCALPKLEEFEENNMVDQGMIDSEQRELEILESSIKEQEWLLESAEASRRGQLINMKGLDWVITWSQLRCEIECKKAKIRTLAFDKWRCQRRLEALTAEFNCQ
jgi:hypothetical protein